MSVSRMERRSPTCGTPRRSAPAAVGNRFNYNTGFTLAAGSYTLNVTVKDPNGATPDEVSSVLRELNRPRSGYFERNLEKQQFFAGSRFHHSAQVERRALPQGRLKIEEPERAFPRRNGLRG